MSRKSMSRKSMSRKSVSRKSMSRKSMSRKSSLGGRRKSMGGGKSKDSGAGSSPEKVSPWIDEINEINLNDEDWRFHLTVVEEKTEDVSGLLDSAGQFAFVDGGNRAAVRVISMDYVKEKALNHCAKARDKTAYGALCEAIVKAAGQYFDQDIPVDLLTYFIKYEIFETRELDLHKQREEAKMAEELQDAHQALNSEYRDLTTEARRGKRGSSRKKSESGRRQSSRRASKKSMRRASAHPNKKQSIRRPSKKQSIRRQSKKQSMRRQSKKQSMRRQSKKQSMRRQSKKQSMRRQSKKQSIRRQSTGIRRKSVAGGGGGKGSPKKQTDILQAAIRKRAQSQKFETKNHVRELPRKDIRYKRDHPTSGPNAYFIVTQIRHPDVVESFKSINVPVDALIMYAEPQLAPAGKPVPEQQEKDYNELLEGLRKAYHERKRHKRFIFDYAKQAGLEKKQIDDYWKILPSRINENPSAYQNVVLSDFRSDLKKIDVKSPNRVQQTKELAYEELSHLSYYLGKISQLHNEFNISVRTIDVKATNITKDEDLAVYKSILDTIPNESYDIPFILDTLLVQVCFNDNAQPGIDFKEYGWKIGPKTSVEAIEPIITEPHRLQKIYDLNKERERIPKKPIHKPRHLVVGDIIKWKTFNLRKLGKYVRDRTYVMQKIFADALIWNGIVVDSKQLKAHEFHMSKLTDAVGVREKQLIAEWLAIMSEFEFLDDYSPSSEGTEMHHAAGRLRDTQSDYRQSSIDTAIGELPCTDRICYCLDKLKEIDEHPQIGDNMKCLNNISKLKDFVFLQLFYYLFNDKDTFTKRYSSLLDAIECEFHNNHYSHYLEGRFEVPVNLRDFYHKMFKKRRSWCLQKLNDMTKKEKPDFVSPMEMLRSNLDAILEPVKVTEDLSVTYKDFIEPHSLREEELKAEEEEEKKKLEELEKKEEKKDEKKDEKKEEEKKQSIVPPVVPDYVGDVYLLDPDMLSIFKERVKNFILNDGTRVRLKYDESVFSKHNLSLWLRIGGHSLHFSTPLYSHTNPTMFHFEHENGMIFSFKERSKLDKMHGTGTRRQSVTARRQSVTRKQSSRRHSRSSAAHKHSISSKIHLHNPNKAVEEKIKLEETGMRDFNARREHAARNRLEKYAKRPIKFGNMIFSKDGKVYYSGGHLSKYSETDSRGYKTVRIHGKKTKLKKPKKPKLKFVSIPFRDDIFNSSDEETEYIDFVEFDVQLSWPNGLHISTEKTDDHDLFYIKQHYLSKTKNLSLIEKELYRCILLDGTVIKFMENNLIEIYYSNGTVVTYRDVKLPEPDAPFKFVSDRAKRISILSSEGKRLYATADGISNSMDGETLQESYDYFCFTQKVERGDGTKFLFKQNGTMIVRFPDGTEIRNKAEFEEEEFFLSWTKDEFLGWFETENVANLDEFDPVELSAERDTTDTGSEKSQSHKGERSKSVASRKKSAVSRKKSMAKNRRASKGSMTSPHKEGKHHGETDNADTSSIKSLPKVEKPKVSIVPRFKDKSSGDKHPEKDRETSTKKDRETSIKKDRETSIKKDGETSTKRDQETSPEKDRESSPEKKLDPREEGFVYVTAWTSKVYHPNYAGISCGCKYENIYTLDLPGETTMYASHDGRFRLIIGENKEYKLKVGPEKVTFDHTADDKLLQRSVLVHSCLKDKNADPARLMFIVKSFDFTDLQVTTVGNITFHALPENEDSESLLEAKHDMRLFSIKRDFSALELLSEKRAQVLKSEFERDKLGKFMRFRESTLTHTVGILPMIPVGDYWRIKYLPIITNNRYDIPSTYGDSYLFPFRLIESEDQIPEMVVFFTWKSINFHNMKLTFYQIFERYFTSCYTRKHISSCDCSLSCLVDDIVGREDATLCQYFYYINQQYGMSKIFSDKHFNRWARNRVAPQILRMATARSQIKQTAEAKKADIRNTHNSLFPVYSYDSHGFIFDIVEEILNIANWCILELHMMDFIEQILNMPIAEVTDEQLKDLCLYLDPRKVGLGEHNRIEMYKMFKTAKELEDNFPTLSHIISYRRKLVKRRKEEDASKADIIETPRKPKAEKSKLVCFEKPMTLFIDQLSDVQQPLLKSHSLDTGIDLKDMPLQCLWAEEKKCKNVDVCRVIEECEDVLEGHQTEFIGAKQYIAQVLKYLVNSIPKLESL